MVLSIYDIMGRVLQAFKSRLIELTVLCIMYSIMEIHFVSVLKEMIILNMLNALKNYQVFNFSTNVFGSTFSKLAIFVYDNFCVQIQ